MQLYVYVLMYMWVPPEVHPYTPPVRMHPTTKMDIKNMHEVDPVGTSVSLSVCLCVPQYNQACLCNNSEIFQIYLKLGWNILWVNILDLRHVWSWVSQLIQYAHD